MEGPWEPKQACGGHGKSLSLQYYGAQVWQQNGRQHTQGIPNSSGTLPSSLEIVVCVLPKIKNL